MSDACRFESQVLTAAEEDRWTTALREHVAGCADCAATATAAPWMDAVLRVEDREHVLPDPSILFLKARSLRASVAPERAARPLTSASMTGYAVVAACLAGLLTWKWAAIEAWVDGFKLAHIIRGDVSGLSLSLFQVVFILSSATVVLALHTILAEE